MPLQICLSRLACFPDPIGAGSPTLASQEADGLNPGEMGVEGWREELAAAGHRAWIVVPTARRRRALQQPRAQGVEGARLLPRLLSLAELSTHLTGFCREQRRLVSAAEQSLRFARALEATGHRASPGMVAHVQRAWNQLYTQQAPGEEFAEVAPPRLRVQPLRETLEWYRSAMGEDFAWDSHLACEHLITELDDPFSPVAKWLERTVPVILLDGFHHLDQQSLRLVEKLGERTEVRWWIPAVKGQIWHPDVERLLERLLLPAGRTLQDPTRPVTPLAQIAEAIDTGEAPAQAVEPPVSPEQTRFVMVAQRRDEPAWVTGEIRKLLREDNHLRRQPHRIALVVPNSAEATRYRLACQRADIPCSAQAETIPLAPTRVARLLQAALTAQDGTFTHEELHTLLGSSLFARNLENRWLLPQLRRLGLGARKAKTPEEWEAFWDQELAKSLRLDPVKSLDENAVKRREARAAELRALGTAAARRLKDLVQVFSEVHPDGNPGTTLVNRLARFMNDLQLDKILGGRERPVDLPERELEEDQLAWNNLLDVLEGIASTPKYCFLDRNGQADIATALRLALESEQFRLRAQDTACVQILLPEALRGGDFDILFWVDFRQDAFPPRSRGEDHIDPGEPGRIEREARLFLNQGLLATSRVVFVRPGQEGEERLQPSPLWNELLTATGIQPEEVTGPIRGEEDSLWQGLRDWRALTETTARRGEIRSWVETQPFRDTTDKKKPVVARQPELADWALPLIRAIWHPERAFSPTALERFAGCPFRFLVEHTLSLRQDDENRIGMYWGNLVHEAIQNSLNPGEPFPTDWGNLTEQLETAHVTYHEFLDEFHGHQTERLAHQMNSGKGIGQLLGYQVHAAEKSFEVDIHPEKTGKIRVQGRIDLVLARNEANYPQRVVVDHKTGRMVSIKAKVEEGRLLQPLLYGWALRKAENRADMTVEAGYLLIRPEQVELKASKDLPTPDGKKTDGRTKPFQMKLDQVEETIVGHVEKIRGGVIHLTSFGPDSPKPECGYCPLKNSCRHPLNG